MYVSTKKQGKISRKQCNIGKYEIFNGDHSLYNLNVRLGRTAAVDRQDFPYRQSNIFLAPIANIQPLLSDPDYPSNVLLDNRFDKIRCDINGDLGVHSYNSTHPLGTNSDARNRARLHHKEFRPKQEGCNGSLTQFSASIKSDSISSHRQSHQDIQRERFLSNKHKPTLEKSNAKQSENYCVNQQLTVENDAGVVIPELLLNGVQNNNLSKPEPSSQVLRVRDLDEFTDLDWQPHKLVNNNTSERVHFPNHEDETNPSLAPLQSASVFYNVDQHPLIHAHSGFLSPVLRVCDLDKEINNEMCYSGQHKVNCDVQSASVTAVGDVTSHTFSRSQTEITGVKDRITLLSDEDSSLSHCYTAAVPGVPSNSRKKVQFDITASKDQKDKSIYATARFHVLESKKSVGGQILTTPDEHNSDSGKNVTLIKANENSISVDENHQKLSSSSFDRSQNCKNEYPVDLHTSCLAVQTAQGFSFLVDQSQSITVSDNPEAESTLPFLLMENVAKINDSPVLESETFDHDSAVKSDPDDENALHTSLNHFSHDSSHLASLGITLRLLRLHRVLHDLNEQQRENVMRKYRCFFRWKKNARLIRFLRQRAEEIERRSEHHYRQHLVQRVFHSWYFFMKVRRSLADSLHQTHMLNKGITALKWLMYKGKERDCWLKQKREFAMQRYVFYFWCLRLNMKKRERLRIFFTRWKSYYRHFLLLSIFTESQKKRQLIQCYCIWRKRLQQRNTENIAKYFHSVKLKKRVWQAWCIYVADKDVHSTQNAVALQHFQFNVLRKTMQRWKTLSGKAVQAELCWRKKILRKDLRNWQATAQSLKILRRKQLCSARLTRSRKLLKRTWLLWTSQLQAVHKHKQNQLECLRSCFTLWRVETENRIFVRSLLEKFKVRALLRRSLGVWKRHVFMRFEKRTIAITQLERFLTRLVFHHWHLFVERKKLHEEKSKCFISHQEKVVCRGSFLRWKALHYAIVSERQLRQQWSLFCVQEALSKWNKFTRKKLLQRKCKLFQKKVSRGILKGCLGKWKRAHRASVSKQGQADSLFILFSKRRVGRMFREWYKVTAEAFLIRPSVEKKNRRKCTRVFDAWRNQVIRKHHLDQTWRSLQQKCLAKMLAGWKWEYRKKQRLEGALEKRREFEKAQAFAAWSAITMRRKRLCALSMLATEKNVRRIFAEWKMRFQIRQLTTRETSLRVKHIRRIISTVFRRWREEVLYRMFVRDEFIANFTNGQRINIKSVAIKRWKKSLINIRLARDFKANIQEKQMRICFREWSSVTKHNIEELSQNFSESLRSGCSRNSHHPCTSFRSLSFHHETSSCSSTKSSTAASHDHENQTHKQIMIHCAHPDHATNSDSGLELFKDSHSDVFSLSSSEKNASSISDTSVDPLLVENCLCAVASFDSEVFMRDKLLQYGIDCGDVVMSRDVSVGSSDVTEELTSNDLAAGESCASQSESSMSWSSDVITQREARSYDYVILTESDDENLNEVREDVFGVTETISKPADRPRSHLDVLFKDSDQSRRGRIVSFALSRLNSPVLSKTFHQWKLVTSTARWNSSMLDYSRQHLKKQEIRLRFNYWKRVFTQRQVSLLHYRGKLTRLCFSEWKDWSSRKSEIHRMKRAADTMNDKRILHSHFRVWVKIYKQRVTLNEILLYWRKRVEERRNFSAPDGKLQRQHDTALMQQCLYTWKLKLKQLHMCDMYHKNVLCDRFFFRWSEYTRQEALEKERIKNFRSQMLKIDVFKRWRRALEMHEKVEERRVQRLRSWLVRLLGRWRTWAANERACHVALENHAINQEILLLKRTFKLWTEKFTLELIAKKSRDSALMRKTVLLWRKYTIDENLQRRKLCILTSKRQNVMVAKHFRLWHSSHQLLVVLKQFATNKQRILWKHWLASLQTKRMKVVEGKALLRCYYTQWKSSYRASKRRTQLARTILTKWFSLVARNQELSRSAAAFTEKKRNCLKKTIFSRWAVHYKLSEDARKFRDRKDTERTFLSWHAYVKEINDQKLKMRKFSSEHHQKHMVAFWQRWCVATTRRISLDSCLNAALQNRRLAIRLRCLLTWKMKLDDVRAKRIYEKRLKLKVITSWLTAYENQRTASTFNLLRITSELRRVVMSWHLLAMARKRQRLAVAEVRTLTNCHLLVVCFAKWKSSSCHSMLAKRCRDESSQKLALRRWYEWTSKAKLLRQLGVHMSDHQKSAYLTSCFATWIYRCQSIQNMEFKCDEMLCQSQHSLVRRCWCGWMVNLEKKQVLKKRAQSIGEMVVKKWKRFVCRKQLRRKMENFQNTILMRRVFSTWQKHFKMTVFLKMNRRKIVEKALKTWYTKASFLLFAHQYSNRQLVIKVWTGWRVRYGSVIACKESWLEMERELLWKTFQGWRCLTTPRNILQKRVEQPSRIPRLKR